jgi:hypothetical protein
MAKKGQHNNDARDQDYLYVTANQLHRQARFWGGQDRQTPYSLFRVRVDAPPVLLR